MDEMIALMAKTKKILFVEIVSYDHPVIPHINSVVMILYVSRRNYGVMES